MTASGPRARRSPLRLAWALALVLPLLIGGCSRTPAFTATDVTGASFGRDFALTDHNGVPRTLADFRGKAVALFFGYTHCPDVCPATMAELAEAARQLGPDAARVQVLFVTVDPERDTRELLRSYVPAFNPTFLGLSGDAEATARVLREFRVIAEKRAGATPDAYTVDHSAGTYLFDPQGRLRVFVTYGQGPDVFVHDIRALLHENG